MKAVEMETVLPSDGKLPAALSEAFGRKVRVILLYEEEDPNGLDASVEPPPLMDLASKIHAFRTVKDPVAYQRRLREGGVGGVNERRTFRDRPLAYGSCW